MPTIEDETPASGKAEGEKGGRLKAASRKVVRGKGLGGGRKVEEREKPFAI